MDKGQLDERKASKKKSIKKALSVFVCSVSYPRFTVGYPQKSFTSNIGLGRRRWLEVDGDQVGDGK
jgi:hypothetical protein